MSDSRCFLATNGDFAGLHPFGKPEVLLGSVPHSETWSPSYDEQLADKLQSAGYEPLVDFLVMSGPKTAVLSLLLAGGEGAHLLLIHDSRINGYRQKVVSNGGS